MKIIVGLGNPGKNYSENRHNIGFKVIDRLARQAGAGYGFRLKRSIRQKAWLGQIRKEQDSFLLVKPRTYMNRSGLCVNKVLAKHKVSLDDLLIIYDDADLELGTLRIKKSGSSGGHRGIGSIIDILGREEISRLKVGIGRPPKGGLTDYVLTNFSLREKEKLDLVLSEAAKLSLNWFEEKKEKTVKID